MEKKHDIIVGADAPRERIDIFLSRETGLSRSQVDKLIVAGHVKLNNGPAKRGHRVRADDRIIVKIPPPKDISARPENIPLDIVYEDKDIIVINKPPGIVVHPAAGNAEGTLVNALLHHCKGLSGIGGNIRPGVVHRLDKDTSGLIVFAKNDASHENLARQFRDREVKKTYMALVRGVIKDDSGTIDVPIGRHPVNRKKMAVIGSGRLKKRNALTRFRVIKRYDGYTLVELDLMTGRTHQIRVHLSHIGHPVAGDETYSRKKDDTGASRQLLHASSLKFNHPVTGKFMEFNSDMPGDMERVLEKLAENKTGEGAE